MESGGRYTYVTTQNRAFHRSSIPLMTDCSCMPHRRASTIQPLGPTWPGRERNGMAQRVISPFDRRERERPAPPGRVSQHVLPAGVPQTGSPCWRLWIIDDSPTVRAVVALYLRVFPLTIQGFAKGKDALQVLRARPEHTPDLVLVDLELPGLDGYQITQAFRSLACCAQTTIIMISGHDRVTDRLKGRLAGVDEYVVKPLTAEKVSALVTTYLPLCLPQPASAQILREQME